MDKKSLGIKIDKCMMCKKKNPILVLDLGHHPHSDYFLNKDELNDPEIHFPLNLVSCTDCGLIQIDYLVNPVYLYQGDYLYQSSTTKTGVSHYQSLAESVVDRFSFKNPDLAIDIGSNVGVLLQGFKNAGMKVLGVDPADVANKAIKKGLDTVIDFFSLKNAKKILKKYGKAKIISGTNVFAHLHDLDDAVEGMKLILDKDGVIVIEAPYVLDLIENLEYDTIYHQHICYLSVLPMKKYFERFGLELFDVQKFTIHGGSLRYFVGHKGAHEIEKNVPNFIKDETENGVYDQERLKEFSRGVEKQKSDLLKILTRLKRQGKKVVALSTPAKGNTLLNYCKIGNDLISFATEKNPLKVGRYTPGMHIPIYNDSRIMKEKPDFALILAWNFSYEIMENMKEFSDGGGGFIIPIPSPRIIINKKK